jgi:hypothetical protein
MPLHPDTCSHCNLALTLTQRAFQVQRPPPEAIREALLLGVGMGSIGATEAEACEECRSYLEKLHAEHEQMSSAATAESSPTPEHAASESQPNAPASK